VVLKEGDALSMSTTAETTDYNLNLTLDELKLLHRGEIKVHAKNSEGEASNTATLTVKGRV